MELAMDANPRWRHSIYFYEKSRLFLMINMILTRLFELEIVVMLMTLDSDLKPFVRTQRSPLNRRHLVGPYAVRSATILRGERKKSQHTQAAHIIG
jgi:hypothetical protein